MHSFTSRPAQTSQRRRGLVLCTNVAALFSLSVSGVLAQQFTDVSSAVGLVQEAKKTWGNPIWGDINNDGYLDLIVPCHGLSASHGPFVYLNNGGTSFTDIRATCGIKKAPELDSTDWHGFAFGDYDGDGNLDVYISEGAKGNQGGTIKRDLLYKGHGDGTFTYVSDTAGIETSMNRGRCGFFFDYDNDGKLDLFVKNEFGNNVLYHNNGDGTFTQVPNAGGLAQATGGTDGGSVVSFADYDNDGYPDVIISGSDTADTLYHNNGDGTFTDVTAAAGLASLRNGQSVAWGDYDNDGYLDLFIPRGTQTSRGLTGCTLYHNNGNGTFTNVTTQAGMSNSGDLFSGIWGDFDNDGYLDLFVTNAGTAGKGQNNNCFLFHNNGNGTFTDVAAAAGVALQDNVTLHKTAAWADYDNDGFLDLLVKDGLGGEARKGGSALGLHRLFRNGGNSNHWIEIRLQGVTSNLHGIGAAVTLTANGAEQFQENYSGGGGEFASQGSEPLHFGIGSADTATVQIKWPSGTVDTVNDVAANSIVTVVEGSGTATPKRNFRSNAAARGRQETR